MSFGSSWIWLSSEICYHCGQRNIVWSDCNIVSNFVWVATPEALAQLQSQLQSQSSIAVDTESDSLYCYFEKVCLLQISAGGTDYLVDPLAVDISPLGALFADERVEKIFHAAEYDILTLKRDYGFHFRNIFDTMLAAKILGWPQCGLGNLLQDHFGVTLNKKYQQYNWGRRPLDEKAMQYARRDTHYLPQLRAVQWRELQAQRREKEARAAFARIAKVRAAPKIFNPADFWRIRGARQLTPGQQAILQALYVFRDERARHADRPPFKLMSDATMIELATQRPRTLAALKRVKGINPTLLHRHGDDLLALLRARHPIPAPQKRGGSDKAMSPQGVLRYEHLRSWRNALARRRGVEPEVILSNRVLRAIARLNPSTPLQLKARNILGKWQLEAYGKAIIEELRKLSPLK